MLDETWEDQYRRLQRSYELLKRTADQNIEREEIHEKARARDILFHFCCDAFHLKDWIKSSTTTLQQCVRDDVKKFIDRNNPNPPSEALAACADIANGFKHRHLDQKPYYTRGGRPAEVVAHAQGIQFPATLPAHFDTNYWIVEVRARRWDALDLAGQAIADWNAWLDSHGLLPPSS
ncbi:MAG: hypothetical protein JWR37_4842 [Mycobacterium sp.]|nr:hypothetical protein [Mycobacterium sp.]